MPEGNRKYNETFQHIYAEIDRIYKEQNPIYSNNREARLVQATTASRVATQELSQAAKAVTNMEAVSKVKTITKVHLLHVKAKLKVDHTVMPDQACHFNYSVQSIFNEMGAIYL
jgi:hypothetical protein